MQFVETICLTPAGPERLALHQQRMDRTVRHFFPGLTLPRLADVVEPLARPAVLSKLRVVYSAAGIDCVECAPYTLRPVKSLRLVASDCVDYSYKSTDRSALLSLLAQRGQADDIIIVKNGLVTDTSYTNIAILAADGHHWLTPRTPLLFGTRRADLLSAGAIAEAGITPALLLASPRIRLFNAMIDFGELEVETVVE